MCAAIHTGFSHGYSHSSIQILHSSLCYERNLFITQILMSATRIKNTRHCGTNYPIVIISCLVSRSQITAWSRKNIKQVSHPRPLSPSERHGGSPAAARSLTNTLYKVSSKATAAENYCKGPKLSCGIKLGFLKLLSVASHSPPRSRLPHVATPAQIYCNFPRV